MTPPDLVTHARTMLAAASTARRESAFLQAFYAGAARMAVVELRGVLQELERHLAALEAELAATAPRGQLEIGARR